MKQEFSPGTVNGLGETLVPGAAKYSTPLSTWNGEAVDSPFVVVKIEDETDSSDTESDSDSAMESDAKWTCPVESGEEEEEEEEEKPQAGQALESKTEGEASTISEKHPPRPVHFKDAEGPKKRATKKRKKKKRAQPRTERKPKRSVSPTQFSERQETLIEAFVESHAEELFGTKWKGTPACRSLWKDLVSQVNATGAPGNGRTTLGAVRKWAVMFKKVDEKTSKQRKEHKSSRKSSRKKIKRDLDAEEPDMQKDNRSLPTNPAARSQKYGTKSASSSFNGASAPYSRLKPPSAISPQQAAEPPPLPFHGCAGEGQCCEKMEGALFEVLNFCEFMCATIQRLEEKIDSLQSNSPPVQERHQNFPIPPQVSWNRGASSWRGRFGLSHLSLPREDNRTAPPSSRLACSDRPPFPWSTRAGRPVAPADPQLDPPLDRSHFPWSNRAGRPVAPADPVTPADPPLDQPTGKRRGRGRPRGRGGSRPAPPVKRAPAGEPSLPGADTKDALQGKVPPTEPSSPAFMEGDQLVLIGSPLRKVRISASEYLKAFKEAEPTGAVGVILKAVFSKGVLAHSGITGNPAWGVQQLDPNKIEAIREWLAEMFPEHDLDVRGADWAACLGVITSVINGLRNGE